MSNEEKATGSLGEEISEPGAKGGTEKINLVANDYSTSLSALQSPARRRLSPVEGALIKLDACERRLHIANTIGDTDTWVRFYRSWLCLHSLAFSYGRWVGEAK